MPLTDAVIKNAKPRPKAVKRADGKCLFPWVNPNGG